MNENDLLEMQTKEGSSFELTWSRVHLTYANQFEGGPEEVIRILALQLREKGYAIEEYSAVEENGACRLFDPPVEHPHTHVALTLTKITPGRFKIHAPGAFRLGDITPHIRLIKKYSHMKYIYEVYHKKEGIPYQRFPEGGPSTWRGSGSVCETVADMVKAGNTNEEILEKTGVGAAPKSASDTLRVAEVVRAAWIAKDNQELLMEKYGKLQLYDWQVIIEKLKEMDPSGRCVAWLYDSFGSAGKSTLAKYLRAHGKAIVLRKWNGKSVAHILRKHRDAGTMPEMVIFDAARSASDEQIPESAMISLYRIAEEIRDGCLTSEKYDSEELVLPTNPMVIIFANTAPDVTKMTMNRWILMIPGPSGKSLSHTFAGTDGLNAIDMAPAVDVEPKRFGSRYALETLKKELESYVGERKLEKGAKHGLARLWKCFTEEVLLDYWRSGYTLELRFGKDVSVCLTPSGGKGVQLTETMALRPVPLQGAIKEEVEQYLRGGRHAKEREQRNLDHYNMLLAKRGLGPVDSVPKQEVCGEKELELLRQKEDVCESVTITELVYDDELSVVLEEEEDEARSEIANSDDAFHENMENLAMCINSFGLYEQKIDSAIRELAANIYANPYADYGDDVTEIDEMVDS